MVVLGAYLIRPERQNIKRQQEPGQAYAMIAIGLALERDVLYLAVDAATDSWSGSPKSPKRSLMAKAINWAMRPPRTPIEMIAWASCALPTASWR